MDEDRSPHAPEHPPGPPHLADPRTLQILSTEHWGQLTARSLVYNEAFTRGSMFLTLLSASLVALGFVYQGSGGGPDFPLIVVTVLSLDLFVGLATLGRLVRSGVEEFRTIQAMNRIRHAYLEMVPTLAPYLPGSAHDDATSVLEIYGPAERSSGPLRDVAYGLTTMPGMVSVLNAAIAGGIGGAVAIAVTGDGRLALIAALGTAAATMLLLAVWTFRTYATVMGSFDARFPAPRSED